MTHEQIVSLQCGDYIANKYGIYQFRSHVRAFDRYNVIIGAKVYHVLCSKNGDDILQQFEIDALTYDALRRSEIIKEGK